MHCAMNEAFGFVATFKPSGFESSLESSCRHVLYKNVSPWQFFCFLVRTRRYSLGGSVFFVSLNIRIIKALAYTILFVSGYFSHFQGRFVISPDYMYALWKTPVFVTFVFVGHRKSNRAILRHFPHSILCSCWLSSHRMSVPVSQ